MKTMVYGLLMLLVVFGFTIPSVYIAEKTGYTPLTYPVIPVYQDNMTQNDTGNPFENFTPEKLFDPSSPLAIVGYLTLFFCLGVPIMLIIITVCVIAIFVRLGKIKKALASQGTQQAYSAPVQQAQMQAQPPQNQQKQF
jgi:hypothetical protein